MNNFIQSLNLSVQTSNDFYGVIFIFVFYVGISIMSVFFKQFSFALITFSIACMYFFLKIFDLKDLYPSFLWLFFNFMNGLFICYLLVTIRKSEKAFQELQDSLHKVIKK